MSDRSHLPLLAWPRRQLLDEAWGLQRRLDAISEEMKRRGDREEAKHGFPVTVRESEHVIGTAYRFFDTAGEAFEAARAYFTEDPEAAPYRVHTVYLGKDDRPTPKPERAEL